MPSPLPNTHSLSIGSQINLQFGYDLRDILTALVQVNVVLITSVKNIPGRFETEDLRSYFVYLAHILPLRDFGGENIMTKARIQIFLFSFLYIT